ncbi:hypothetical protein BH09VER1_BH09VER1_46510 [soil metagenome]
MAAGTFKPNGSRIVIDGTETEVDKKKFPEALREKIDLRRSVASQFHILDDHGNGFLVKLDSERPLLVCRSGLHSFGDIRHDRVEISLQTT